MANEEIKPLIPESSTSESTNVQVMLQDLQDGTLVIPDYQRDSDQWDLETKSLLVESVINNLTIPAFFFEVKIEDGLERNEVVDGQQRLSTLAEFFKNKFRLVSSDDAPYLTPNSVHYAGKTFDELPAAYQHAFKKYRIAVIKLRDLEDTRLEVFRRINQGGTPLSGQDIRLAYYGKESKTVRLIRLAGIFDKDRAASKRFIASAKSEVNVDFPWDEQSGFKNWSEWWEGKKFSTGQGPSEMFLWSLIAAQHDKLDQLLNNQDALRKLQVRFNRTIDEALDAYCAQCAYQDTNNEAPALLMTYQETSESFFPYFAKWMDTLLGEKMVSAPLPKRRVIAGLIGAANTLKIDLDALTNEQWDEIVDFVRKPAEKCKIIGLEWPSSKGKWDGDKGYRAQFETLKEAVKRLTSARIPAK